MENRYYLSSLQSVSTLNLYNITSKYHIGLQCAGTFMIHTPTNFMSRYDGPLGITSKPKDKYIFRMVAILLFYTP